MAGRDAQFIECTGCGSVAVKVPRNSPRGARVHCTYCKGLHELDVLLEELERRRHRDALEADHSDKVKH